MPPSHRPPHHSHSLLLLPPAPTSPTYPALKAAYHASLSTVLRELARSSQPPDHPTVLDIALPCPHLYGHLNSPRGPLYAATQLLVANLYKLICVIAASHAIDTDVADAADRLDARVILVAYPRDGNLMQNPGDATPEQEIQGPAIDLHTLARCPRPWDTVYSVESEQGEKLLKTFLALGAPQRNLSRVQGGIVQVDGDTNPHVAEEQTFSATPHSSVILGGTFDHLHLGHKLLLTMFAFVLRRGTPSLDDEAPGILTIGITGDELLKNKKYADVLESWDRRQEATHNFLNAIINFGPDDDNRIRTEHKYEPGPNGRAVHVHYPFNLVIKYVDIWDPYGPTITEQDITALVISKETRSGGAAVNKKRGEKGWHDLEVFEVDVLDAGEEHEVDETFQSKLSSTEIRRRLSERIGHKTGA